MNDRTTLSAPSAWRTWALVLGAVVLASAAHAQSYGSFNVCALESPMTFRVNGIAVTDPTALGLATGPGATTLLDVGFARPPGADNAIVARYTGSGTMHFGAATVAPNSILRIWGIRGVYLTNAAGLQGTLGGDVEHAYAAADGGSGGTMTDWTEAADKASPLHVLGFEATSKGGGFPPKADWLALMPTGAYSTLDWTAYEKARYGTFTFRDLVLGASDTLLGLDVMADVYDPTGTALAANGAGNTGRLLITDYGLGAAGTGERVPEAPGLLLLVCGGAPVAWLLLHRRRRGSA